MRIRPAALTGTGVRLLLTACLLLTSGTVLRAQTVDPTFNPGVDRTVHALAVQADGRIVVGGRFTMLGGGAAGSSPRSFLGRVNADGTLDTGFELGTNAWVYALAVQADGKILVGGRFTSIGAGTSMTARNYLARINADGTLDTGFDPGANDWVNALAVQPDGKILVGGRFTMLGGGGTGTTPRQLLGRLNADGSIDTSFDPGAFGTSVDAMTVQANGQILVGGSFQTLGGGGWGTTPRANIGRFNADGSLDVAFDPGANAAVYALAVQANGQILAGGAFQAVGGGTGTTHTRNRIARFEPDGSVDASFFLGAGAAVRAIEVQATGRILVGGDFTSLGPAARYYCGRFYADGSLDTGFDLGANNSVYVLAEQANGQVLVGGAFSMLGGGGFSTTPNQYLRRLQAEAVITGPPSFTDHPLVPGTTAVRAVHVNELRDAINQLRVRAGLTLVAWTDAPITPGVTLVRAAHLAELRTALGAVYVAAGRAEPSYTNADPAEGMSVIAAVDIAELRAAVGAIW